MGTRTEHAAVQNLIRVGGIKLSPELISFVFTHQTDKPQIIKDILSQISLNQLNIVYLSQSVSNPQTTTTICVETPFGSRTQNLIEAHKSDSCQLHTIDSVGTITVFPHKNSLTLLGRILKAFYTTDIPVHGICTSISALTLLTDYSLYDIGIKCLETIVELPENHTPLRQEFSICQIGL